MLVFDKPYCPSGGVRCRLKISSTVQPCMDVTCQWVRAWDLCDCHLGLRCGPCSPPDVLFDLLRSALWGRWVELASTPWKRALPSCPGDTGVVGVTDGPRTASVQVVLLVLDSFPPAQQGIWGQGKTRPETLASSAEKARPRDVTEELTLKLWR